MIAGLRVELASYEDGKSSAGKRQQGGDRIDITPFRIEQIKRDISALEDAIGRHKKCNA